VHSLEEYDRDTGGGGLNNDENTLLLTINI